MTTKTMAVIGGALAMLLTACGSGDKGPPPKKAPIEDPSQARETAPDVFRVRLETSKGDIVIQVTRAWAPNGADRFYNLVRVGFYDDCRFFRVIPGFMAQLGMNGDPDIQKAWLDAKIPDDPVVKSNKRGYVSFATSGRNSRTTQFFINLADNKGLDDQGFSPFGQVIDDGMSVAEKLYSGYGEGAPKGKGPLQGLIRDQGNVYLKRDFPELDFIRKATLAP